MGYTIKDLKMYIKYLKKALKMINKTYKWPWNPIPQPLSIKQDLENQLRYYKDLLHKLRWESD